MRALAVAEASVTKGDSTCLSNLRNMNSEGESQRSALEELVQRVELLSTAQIELIVDLVATFESVKPRIVVLEEEAPLGLDFANALSLSLILHHQFSSESFTKDKFEHALNSVLGSLGHECELAPRGNPGHDVTVDGERWSLKTQADASIREDQIHISKFMELGRGAWESEADLEGLRSRMFEHMSQYDRIFTLRCLTARRDLRDGSVRTYELVEIPKSLLLESADFPCEMRHDSTQSPKPGSCTVTDAAGSVKFELYFDGGTERKLQVRKLAKQYCIVHARWDFDRDVAQ